MNEKFEYLLVEEGEKTDRLIIQFTSGGLSIDFNHGDSTQDVIYKLQSAINKINKADKEGWKDL